MKTWTRLGLCFVVFFFSQQLSAAAPDLAFSGPVTATPNPATPGSTVTFNYRVKNQGNGYAGGSLAAVEIARLDSFDPTTGFSIYDVAYFFIGALPAGASASYSHSLTLSGPLTPGDYIAGVVLDVNSEIGQSDESNDFATIPFSIVPTSSASPENCQLSFGQYSPAYFYYAVAYEVNGVSYCGSPIYLPLYTWTINVPYGQKVKIRYALRSGALVPCSSPLYLGLNAPAMGVNGKFLNSQGTWTSSLGYFRSAPPLNAWSDLYDDFPPKGNYYLEIGCDPMSNGAILFDVK